jgi:chromosomal replication initiator protein
LTEQLVRPAVDSGVDVPPAGDFDKQFHRAVRDRVGAARYDLWFPGRARFVRGDNGVVVGVGNLILQNVFQRGFDDAIRAAAAELLDRPVEVRYRIDPELFRQIRAEQARVEQQEKAQETKPAEPDLFTQAPAKPQAAKRRWRHLHDFVIGACNRVAFAAATSVVEAPGEGPNPLVIHGPVGTGKTHLLEGVYAGLRRRRPDFRVLYVSAEDFTNRFVAALRFGKQGSFRRHFRTCDVFLLDDLHFLAKKRASQEEFLHTFDALLADGRQVVLTCDCHPRLNDDFGPELTDRLLGGAIWGMQPPDIETRLALLRAKSAFSSKPKAPALDESEPRGRVAIPDEVLAFLAERLRGNVRELEGALHSLRHFARVTGRGIDRDLAREALGDLLRHAVRVVRVGDVDAAVCNVLRLPPGTLQGKERSWGVSHPRMIAVYLARKHTAASYGEISKHFGGKSHGTAVAAEKKVRQWLISDEKLAAGGREWSVRELVERIERELMT